MPIPSFLLPIVVFLTGACVLVVEVLAVVTSAMLVTVTVTTGLSLTAVIDATALPEPVAPTESVAVTGYDSDVPLASPFIAELFGSNSGLGYLMQQAQDQGRVDTIIAVCLAIVFFVVLGDALVMRPLSRMFDPASGDKANAGRTGKSATDTAASAPR